MRGLIVKESPCVYQCVAWRSLPLMGLFVILVSENKVLCHPASVDSLSTSAATEDHVSMGGFAARKALKVVENVERGKRLGESQLILHNFSQIFQKMGKITFLHKIDWNWKRCCPNSLYTEIRGEKHIYGHFYVDQYCSMSKFRH